MSQTNGRVFARLMDWTNASTTPDGQLMVRVEFSLLDGTRRNGKLSVTANGIINRDKLARDVTDSVIDQLNAMFPGANYRARDLVLWGG